MTTLEQHAEHFAQNPCSNHGDRAGAFLAKAVLAIALLPLLLVVAALVAKDVGFPLVSWTRTETGNGNPAPTAFKFRTTRFDAHNPWRILRQQSRIGHFLSRTGLDRLPELYLGSVRL